jgi:hypothetical protein
MFLFVTDILISGVVFGNAVAPNVADSTIHIAGLEAVGDQQAGLLQTALKL